jgi:hypothetical protein
MGQWLGYLWKNCFKKGLRSDLILFVNSRQVRQAFFPENIFSHRHLFDEKNGLPKNLPTIVTRRVLATLANPATTQDATLSISSSSASQKSAAANFFEAFTT